MTDSRGACNKTVCNTVLRDFLVIVGMEGFRNGEVSKWREVPCCKPPYCVSKRSDQWVVIKALPQCSHTDSSFYVIPCFTASIYVYLSVCLVVNVFQTHNTASREKKDGSTLSQRHTLLNVLEYPAPHSATYSNVLQQFAIDQ